MNPTSPTSERKVSVTAPANIAFIKYWGARDLARAIPLHPSISMTLSRCRSHTTVEHSPAPGEDEVLLATAGGSLSPAPPAFAGRVRAHLDRLRRWAGAEGSFRVATRNSFPAAAGMASSASGFAALTLAAAGALGRSPSPEEASDLARASGSGSAARSLMGGYVEWPAEGSDAAFPARQLAPAAHWDLRDVIALVDRGAKEVSSLDGHRRAPTSPHFARRLELLPERLERVRRALRERDITGLGEVLEEDAIELHLIAMSSRPPIFYWRPATLEVLAAVRRLRDGREACPAYATLDAGANVHVLCPAEHEERVVAALRPLPGVHDLLRDRVGDGPSGDCEHLF